MTTSIRDFGTNTLSEYSVSAMLLITLGANYRFQSMMSAELEARSRSVRIDNGLRRVERRLLLHPARNVRHVGKRLVTFSCHWPCTSYHARPSSCESSLLGSQSHEGVVCRLGCVASAFDGVGQVGRRRRCAFSRKHFNDMGIR